MRIETEKIEYRDVRIDVLCGIIMILIVLDHTRDFFFGFLPNPTNINETTPFFLNAGLLIFVLPASSCRRFGLD